MSKKVTVAMKPTVINALKKHAQDENTSMTKIIEQLVTDYLESLDLMPQKVNRGGKKTILKESDLL